MGDRRVRWLESEVSRLGRLVLDLQSQATHALHVAERHGTIAQLVEHLGADRSAPLEPQAFARRFLEDIALRLRVDVAVLWVREGERLIPLETSGARLKPLPLNADPPSFCVSGVVQPMMPGFVSALCDAAALPHVLWAWDAEAETGLLLANALHTSDYFDQFGEDDASTVRSALRVFLDTRRRLEAEAALHRRLVQANALSRISTAFIHMGPESFSEAVRSALEDFTQLLGADRGCLLLVDPRQDTVRRAYTHDETEAFVGHDMPTCWPLASLGPLLGRLRRQEVARVRGGSRPDRLQTPFLAPLHEGDASMALFVPITYQQSLDGFFGFLSKTDRHAWAAPDVTFLRTVASVFASALAAHRDRQERAALHGQIQQSQKLNSLGVLAGGIAHDFNNILTPILSGLELSLLLVGENDRVSRVLQGALDATERARRLVQQILLFSRKSSPERRPVEALRLVNDACELLRASLPATIEIDTAFEPDARGRPATVLGDATQLVQVLVNLGTNAWQAMEGQRGHLSIRTSVVEVPEHAVGTHAAPGPGAYARLEVQDTGPGIPADVQPHIFDPFFTTKAAGQGTGMGLAVVHGIVSNHGGFIAFDTGPEGTTFRVWLPLSGFASVESTDLGLPTVALRGAEGVLVVDDEPDIAWRIRQMLARLGYSVVAVTSPTDALEALAESPDAYQLLITDFTMPEMTGLELAIAARKTAPDLRILLCTGYHEPLGPEAMTAAHIAGTVHKPFRYTTLARLVRRTLDHDPTGEQRPQR